MSDVAKPLDGFTASSGQSAVITPNLVSGKDELTVQVEITAAAAVDIEGRLSEDAPWFLLTTLTDSGIQPLALMTQVRFNVSGNSGTVNAWIRY